jgi:hypothetical protein
LKKWKLGHNIFLPVCCPGSRFHREKSGDFPILAPEESRNIVLDFF